MTRLPLIAALSACLTLAAPAALAAETRDKPTFESLDKNSDGKVSVSEATEHDALFVAFKNLDKDKDGELTREEFAEFEPRG